MDDENTVRISETAPQKVNMCQGDGFLDTHRNRDCHGRVAPSQSTCEKRTTINETASVGRGHVLLNQRLCLRGQSPLVSRLDSATPSCSLSPPQAALASVPPPSASAADSRHKQACTQLVVPAPVGTCPHPTKTFMAMTEKADPFVIARALAPVVAQPFAIHP